MTSTLAPSRGDLESTHFFSGGGGDTLGFQQAGFRPRLAINHDKASIATHKANFRDCEHLDSNIQEVEMRRLPRTPVLWASPICTEISPAGGRKRTAKPDQRSLFDPEQEEAPPRSESFERTRVTALSIIAAAEAHRYDVVAGENVIEFATDWELFPWWVQGMKILKYQFQMISVNAAHISGPDYDAVAQWRDRLFFVFAREGVKMPRLEPRPLAWCTGCDRDVRAKQWFKDPKKKIGKYRVQYLYRCPNHRCKQQVVEPYVRPASSILDFNHLGTRIGDRKRPLVPATLGRVRAGLDALAARQMMISVNHGGADDGRAYLPHTRPLPSRTVKIGDGLVTPPGLVPFIAELRNHGTSRPVSDPLSTVTAGGNHHALVVPYYSNGSAKPVTDPLSTVTTRDRHALVTETQHLAVEDCFLRMVQPVEQFLSQGFPVGYERRGTRTEQTMQAGNAVPVNVARWIGDEVYAALGGGVR